MQTEVRPPNNPIRAGRGRSRRIAVIGSGISGLTTAFRMDRDHDVTVFEAAPRAGGHAHTMTLDWDGSQRNVETGFVVFNRETYPNFVALLAELGVKSQPSDMSFSVRCEHSGIEYCGSGPAGLFAQKRNLFRPSFLRMLGEIVRFNRQASLDLREDAVRGTMREYLGQHGFGGAAIDRYVVPMGAAIWSAPPQRILDFPAVRFLGFLNNHRLLQVDQQLRWRTIAGGSRSYLDALTARLRRPIRLRTPVRVIRRTADGVLIRTDSDVEPYDEVVLAVHADQALALLERPTPAEVDILGAITFQRNEVTVHGDASLVPRRRRARASWNYLIPAGESEDVITTYDMSRLQSLATERSIYVSVNGRERIDPGTILAELQYSHPQFTEAAIAAQARHAEISGAQRVHYCGAYWRNGFHEDGVVSALSVVRAMSDSVAAGSDHA